ncbi:MAG: hypothetical protein LBV13_04600 [Methanomassiliicoccaceae archaeon]|nr:hypothetical protein [Methanomassiliicoccaceae archaeon]
MVKTEAVYEQYQELGTAVDILMALLQGMMMASDVRKVADYRTGISKLRQFLDVGLVELTIEATSGAQTGMCSLKKAGRPRNFSQRPNG